MKLFLQIVLSAGGGALIGIFAKQLDTIMGCVLFALGIVLITISASIRTNTFYKR